MSEFWQGIWTAAAISVPIGLLINYLSKRLDISARRRSEKAIARHLAENDAFESQAQRLAKSQEELSLYSRGQTLTVIYRIALGLFEGALAVMLKLLSSASTDPIVSAWGLVPVMVIVGLAGWHFLRGMTFAEETIRTLRRINEIASSPPVADASSVQTPAIPPHEPASAP